MDGALRRRGVLWWGAAIAAIALVLRVLHIVQAQANDPVFRVPQLDMLYHHQWATAVSTGVQFVHGAFLRAPLYPHLIGTLYILFGPSPLAARLFQSLLGSVSCVLVYLLARRVMRDVASASELSVSGLEWVARAAGLALAAYPLAVYYDTELLVPVLLVFLCVAGILLLYRSWDRDGQWWVPGLVFGLAVLTRANTIVVVVALTIWLLIEFGWRGWRRPLVFAGVAALVVLPVGIRNLVRGGTFIPVAAGAGVNFFIGNNPESDGTTAQLPGTESVWWRNYVDVRRLAEKAEGRVLSASEVDTHWFSRGFRFWIQEPARAIGLLFRKGMFLVSGRELPNNRDLYFLKRFSFIDWFLWATPMLKFPLGLVFPLAVSGVLLARRSRRRLAPVYLFIAAYGLSFLPFFITARFRMPMIPLVLFLASAAVALFLRRGATARDRVLALLAFGLAFVPANVDLFRFSSNQYQSHYSMAYALHREGRTQEALRNVRTALQSDSNPGALNLETQILLKLGLEEEAEEAAEAALLTGQGFAETRLTLGVVRARQGEYDSAVDLFEEALRFDPGLVEGWVNLANVSMLRSDTAKARREFERALELDPNNATALYGRGVLEAALGNRAIARQYWKAVLKIQPNHRSARNALERTPWP